MPLPEGAMFYLMPDGSIAAHGGNPVALTQQQFEDCCCCPAYPVKLYATGGIAFTGGYRSMELQAVDNNGTRVYDWRDKNDGSFAGDMSVWYSGCTPTLLHTFDAADDPCYTAENDPFTKEVCPADFVCCAPFGGGGSWCDNPQGVCWLDEEEDL